MIYCIGDSHVSLFSGEDAILPVWPAASRNGLPGFQTHHLGAALAYNLSREGTRTQGREKLLRILSTEVPDGATVLLSFGEIDCRVHLIKQAQHTGKPLEKVVDLCLEGYFKAVEEVRSMGYTVIVYNAVLSRPRVRGIHRPNDEEYATFGTREQRSLAIRLFNAGAKRRCRGSGLYFLETIPQLADRNGLIPTWYFMDSIHLSQRAMPATLRELARLMPALELEVPPLPPATRSRQFTDWLSKRRTRLLKEFRKVWPW